MFKFLEENAIFFVNALLLVGLGFGVSVLNKSSVSSVTLDQTPAVADTSNATDTANSDQVVIPDIVPVVSTPTSVAPAPNPTTVKKPPIRRPIDDDEGFDD
jgi:hypothetical protein